MLGRKWIYIADKIKYLDDYGKMNLFNFLKTTIDADKIQSIINAMNEQDIIVKSIMIKTKLSYYDDWITLFNEINEINHKLPKKKDMILN